MSGVFLRLKGRMLTEGYKADTFAEAMGINASTLSAKMNGKRNWKDGEMIKACHLLHIPLNELHLYFFDQ